MLYQVRTLTSHNTEESENSPESPHLGEIKRMRKQCVPGASPFFARAGDKATSFHVFHAPGSGASFTHSRAVLVVQLQHSSRNGFWNTVSYSHPPSLFGYCTTGAVYWMYVSVSSRITINFLKVLFQPTQEQHTNLTTMRDTLLRCIKASEVWSAPYKILNCSQMSRALCTTLNEWKLHPH